MANQFVKHYNSVCIPLKALTLNVVWLFHKDQEAFMPNPVIVGQHVSVSASFCDIKSPS